MPYQPAGFVPVSSKLIDNPVPNICGGSSEHYTPLGSEPTAGRRFTGKSWDVIDMRPQLQQGNGYGVSVPVAAVSPAGLQQKPEMGRPAGLRTTQGNSPLVQPAQAHYFDASSVGIIDTMFLKEAEAQQSRRRQPQQQKQRFLATSPSDFDPLPPPSIPKTPQYHPISAAPAAQAASRPRASTTVHRSTNGIHDRLYRQALKRQGAGNDRYRPHTVVDPNFVSTLRSENASRRSGGGGHPGERLTYRTASKPRDWGAGNVKRDAWEWRNPAKLVEKPEDSYHNCRATQHRDESEKIWQRLHKGGEVKKSKNRQLVDTADTAARTLRSTKVTEQCYRLAGSTFGTDRWREKKQHDITVSPVRVQARAKVYSSLPAWHRLHASHTRKTNHRSLALTESRPPPKFRPPPRKPTADTSPHAAPAAPAARNHDYLGLGGAAGLDPRAPPSPPLAKAHQRSLAAIKEGKPYRIAGEDSQGMDLEDLLLGAGEDGTEEEGEAGTVTLLEPKMPHAHNVDAHLLDESFHPEGLQEKLKNKQGMTKEEVEAERRHREALAKEDRLREEEEKEERDRRAIAVKERVQVFEKKAATANGYSPPTPKPLQPLGTAGTALPKPKQLPIDPAIYPESDDEEDLAA